MGDGKSAVKDSSSRDSDAMCSLWRPPHPASFAHTGVADVIDTAFCPGRRNCETVSISMAIVRERVKILGKVGVEFLTPGNDASACCSLFFACGAQMVTVDDENREVRGGSHHLSVP